LPQPKLTLAMVTTAKMMHTMKRRPMLIDHCHRAFASSECSLDLRQTRPSFPPPTLPTFPHIDRTLSLSVSRNLIAFLLLIYRENSKTIKMPRFFFFFFFFSLKTVTFFFQDFISTANSKERIRLARCVVIPFNFGIAGNRESFSGSRFVVLVFKKNECRAMGISSNRQFDTSVHGSNNL
jgi:hypothetical protein